MADDFENEALELIDQLKTKNKPRQIDLLTKASQLMAKSTNPESAQICLFLDAMSLRIKGSIEKNHHKAIQFFDESIALLGQIEEEKGSDLYHETMIMKLRRELDRAKGNYSKASEIFLQIAEEERILNRDENYHIGKGMHYFLKSVHLMESDANAAFSEIDSSISEFSKTGKAEMISKIKASRLRLLASLQYDPRIRLELLNKSLKEIESTSDKVGLKECKGQISFISALIERKWKSKAKLFKKAAEYFKEIDEKKYYASIGAKLFWDSYDAVGGIEKSISLLKKSADYFEKSGSVIDYHRAMGLLKMLHAIRDGVMKHHDENFKSNLVEANSHFAKAFPNRELNLTAGVILLFEASKMEPEKAEDALDKAGEILGMIHDPLSHFAFYQFYLLKANLASDNPERFLEYQRSALNNLEKWLESLDQKARRSTNDLNIDSSFMEQYFQADYYFLKGRLTFDDPPTQKELFKKSLVIYNELENKKFIPDKVLRSKGWVYMFLMELDKAVTCFDKAHILNPSSESLQRDKEFALEQLKAGFCDLKRAIRRQSFFQIELQKSLSSQYSYPDVSPDILETNFTERAITNIQKAGKALEENYPQHVEKGEEGLRDELNQCLSMIYSGVHAESKKAKGKRDIVIEDQSSGESFTAECLIWNGQDYYSQKKEQIFDRYLTRHDKTAALITFVRNDNFAEILKSAVDAIKNLNGIQEGSFMDLSYKSMKLFTTTHAHKSGEKIKLFHLFFHLPKR